MINFKMLRSGVFAWVPFLALVSSAPALALTNYTPSDLSAFTNDSVKSLVQTVGIGSDHHAYMPATPLGIMIGVDIGLDMTYISFPSEFQQALATATGQATNQIGSGAPLPKLNIHKGLPFGIDLGFSFMSLSSGGTQLYKSFGGDIKYAILSGVATPAVAVRFSGTYNSLYFIKTHTYDLDLVVSKNLLLIDPYAGAGLQFWSGEIAVPSGIPALPAGIDASQGGTTPRLFGGVMLKLAILKITAQMDLSTSGITTYGGKLSFGF